ncbi:hypothetical protein [Sphingomonas carotinifaciens]|uniref:LTXXQ motif family protein n=1 Tax=Sphingomonas carotinifaciens TaxID=1166323 RepID=A0A1G7PUN9_9SPHN|nr:hypothetical protein [Sphingomonas carotinifaciens]MBB4087515.1 hypothetical protein [Sphingomonas carotinifaciens]MWC45601.1 hypothetical protein [Sphingomonas carotinifaciens]SDF90032.1 hypothetical protein SAMN05216557_10789 [Sphingomonas carotinifaciens]
MKNKVVMIMLMGLALPAVAQQAGPVPQGRGAGPDHAARQRREADDLALVLGLRQDQRPALDAFLAASGPPARPERRAGERPALPNTPPSFEQELDRMAERDTRHAAEARQRIGAARAFFAQLDQRQKQIFEAVMRLRRGPGGFDRPGPGGPGPRGPEEHGPGGPPPEPGLSRK